MCVCVTDLEARERQAEAQSQEEVQITRTLEEEVRVFYRNHMTSEHMISDGRFKPEHMDVKYGGAPQGCVLGPRYSCASWKL